MLLTDSHCHLDFEEFNKQLPLLIKECSNKGIHQIIVPAISPDNWLNVLNLFNNNFYKKNISCKIYPCLGIHPWFLKNLTHHHLQALSDLVAKQNKNIIAIGETGIDGVIALEQNNLNQQVEFFNYQLTLAKHYNLPVIIHHRRSHAEILAILKQEKPSSGGIIHAFSGSYQQACQYIDLDFKLGIGGIITYPRAEKTIKTIKRVPSSSLVLETDAPAMPLWGHQGKMNSPLRVIDVLNRLADIRKEPVQELSQIIEQNIHKLFNLNSPS